MRLRLRPGHPVVWRTPERLQIGSEAVAILDDPPPGVERLVLALQAGAWLDELYASCEGFGLDRAGLDRVLTELAPALDAGTTATATAGSGDGDDAASSSVSWREGGPSVRGPRVRLVELRSPRAHVALRDALARAGVEVLAVPAPSPADGAGDAASDPRLVRRRTTARPDFVVEHADFVVPPSRCQGHLSADTPHLAVVAGDRWIDVTPVVVPGLTPCMRCDDLARIDADPAWPAVATQLGARRSTVTYDGALEACADAAVARIVLAYSRGEPAPLDGATARFSDPLAGPLAKPRRFHPACGCRDLPGSATAPVPPRAARRPARTTAAACAERG